jgi:hydrogenase maturation factor
MSYPGNEEEHNHNSNGCVVVGGTTGTVISGPDGIILETNALGCIPAANFGINIVMSGTPSGVRRPQTLRR